jgi:hypothetical protein
MDSKKLKDGLSKLHTRHIHELKQLIWTSCTFVFDWDSPTLEHSVIWVFGLHDAVKHAEATMLQRIKDSNLVLLSCSA